MRNADTPAMPQTDKWVNQAVRSRIPLDRTGRRPESPPTDGAGLSKREHFAALAMQPVASMLGEHIEDGEEEFAEVVVAYADALPAKLEETK